MAKVWRYLLPLGIFAVLVWFLFKGLSLNPREVPSPLVNRPVPNFTLPKLHAPDQKLSASDLKGQVWLLNVWGSWCVSCRIEHPLLNELAKNNVVPIYGLNWKDKREDAIGWLNKFGDPYVASIADLDGRVAIDRHLVAAFARVVHHIRHGTTPYARSLVQPPSTMMERPVM